MCFMQTLIVEFAYLTISYLLTFRDKTVRKFSKRKCISTAFCQSDLRGGEVVTINYIKSLKTFYVKRRMWL